MPGLLAVQRCFSLVLQASRRSPPILRRRWTKRPSSRTCESILRAPARHSARSCSHSPHPAGMIAGGRNDGRPRKDQHPTAFQRLELVASLRLSAIAIAPPPASMRQAGRLTNNCARARLGRAPSLRSGRTNASVLRLASRSEPTSDCMIASIVFAFQHQECRESPDRQVLNELFRCTRHTAPTMVHGSVHGIVHADVYTPHQGTAS